MADKPVGEVVQVDAVLDALVSPTSSDVYEALLPYGNDAVAAVAAKRAAGGGGGGSQAGFARLYSFPFAYNTPDLLTGVTVVAETSDGQIWTPAVDDILLDAWFEGDPDDLFDAPEAFPTADIGRISAGSWVDSGWFNHSGAGINLSDLNVEVFGGAVTNRSLVDFPASLSAAPAWNAATTFAGSVIPQRRLTTADPVQLVVSGDGAPGGTDPESTQGSVVLRLLVVTP